MIRTILLNLRCAILFAVFTSLSLSLTAQSQEFATTIVAESEVDISANAVDTDLTTFSEIRANSGLALGIGAYSGNLEVAYPQILGANTAMYVRIDTEDHLLSCLLGGNIGGLLADIAGVALLGNQEFSIEAKNGGNTVLSGHSNILGSFSNDDLRVVVNSDNKYFLALNPSEAYDRIVLENRVGSLIGLNNTRRLSISGAFYTNGNDECGAPGYTSYNGHGLTLDLLNIGGAGVTDPNFAIDGDSSTFSQLGLGLIGVAADIQQTVYFDTPSFSDDSFFIQLALDPSLLQAGIANNIEIVAQNGPDNEVFSGNLSSFLNVDLLGLLQSNNTATIELRPESQVDRLTIRLSSLLNASLDQQIRIHDVYRSPSIPTIDPISENTTVCNGSSASLVATAMGGPNTELRWYDASVDGNLLATVNSGEAFVTTNLTSETSFYVAAANQGCTEESPRMEVTVNIAENPKADDILVMDDMVPSCSSSEVVLIPSSEIDGDFSWYFDANGNNEITDGLVSGGATYTIDSEGVLTIIGLTEANGPYTFYAKLTESSASCENAPGDLKAVTFEVVDSNFNSTATIDATLTLENLIDIFQGNSDITISGNVNGDANTGDSISLFINNNRYDGLIDASLNFSILVDGYDLVYDSNKSIEYYVSNGTCSVSGQSPIIISQLPKDNLFQTFCESDMATIADLQFSINEITFFESLTSDIAVEANSSLVDGQVYYAGILNIPVSILQRVEITVDIISVPPPTTNSTEQVFCETDEPIIADIQVNEADVAFYDSETDGSELDPSTPLEDDMTYYVANRESGCESVTRLAITTYISDDEPIIITGEFEEVCLNREYTYATESGKENYLWTVTGGTITEGGNDTDDFVSVRWSELENVEISVSYVDNENCNSEEGTTLAISIVSCGEVLGEEFALKVYNEFSPNNDGFNDFFKVEGLEAFSNTIRIYNRNGNLVFRDENYQNNWDGISNGTIIIQKGKPLPSGTYYYRINIPELERELVGWIQLAR